MVLEPMGLLADTSLSGIATLGQLPVGLLSVCWAEH